MPGKRIVVEGVAEDGTIEAIRIADAPGFALGVQWHAEYDPQQQSGEPDAVRGVRRGRFARTSARRSTAPVGFPRARP